MIEVRALQKRFADRNREHQALQGVSFAVPAGVFYTLLGPSGCGKTTLLRCIAGLEVPDLGEISLGGRVVFSRYERVNIPAFQRSLGMVFQSYAIWPHYTVFENVAFPLTTRRPRPSRAVIRQRVQAVLDLVGLGAMSGRSATGLSGGEQQRLALARAIVGNPKVLLLDEPLSNLDANLREQMRSEIRSLQRRLSITTVYVTHDQLEALAMSDRVAVMNAGRIVQEGTPDELYRRPASRFVAGFIGGANLLDGEWRRRDSGLVFECQLGGLLCAGSEPNEGRGMMAVRPEAVQLTVDRPGQQVNVFGARIDSVQFLGAFHEYRVSVNGHALRVHTPASPIIETGCPVFVHIPAEACIAVEDSD